MSLLKKPLTFITAVILSGHLTSCVSYAPRLLVPNITLSAEEISLSTAQVKQGNGVDFGLELRVNESDSLVNIEILPGVRVSRVSPGGAAGSASIQAGDIILSIDDMQTNHPDIINELARKTRQETEFVFHLRRNTTVLEATVIARPASRRIPIQELHRIDPIASRASYRTEIIDLPDKVNVSVAKIVEIQADSPLHKADLRVDDLILAVDQRPISSAQNLIDILNTDYALGDTVRLSVFTDTQITEHRVKLWHPGRSISKITLGPLLQYNASQDPKRKSFTLLNLWFFSVYNYQRVEGERTHSLLGLLNYASDYGELIEDGE